MQSFNEIVAELKRHYGKPDVPSAKGPFELVMWENACYLLPDERRLKSSRLCATRLGSPRRPSMRTGRGAASACKARRHAARDACLPLAPDCRHHIKSVWWGPRLHSDVALR
jgi:hypothetical protein